MEPALYHYLEQHHLFRALNPEQMRQACLGAGIIDSPKGAHLFEQGDRANYFYFLLEGQIKLSRLSPDGDEKIIEVVTPGSTFAEALMFLKVRDYPVAAQALRDSRLIRVHMANYYSVVVQSVDTCLALLGDLSSRLRGLVNEIDNLTLHNAARRVAGYLLTQVSDLGLNYELDVPKLVLASRLAVKPETFSRILKQLSDDRLVRVKANQVQILDLEGLKRYSESCALQEGSLQASFHLPSGKPGKACGK
jgi:CRP/FNR family transcriptional regulator, dissimilatory nitrate respiration regulator